MAEMEGRKRAFIPRPAPAPFGSGSLLIPSDELAPAECFYAQAGRAVTILV